MFVFKIDVLEELKRKGITTTAIRDTNIIGQKTLADIKKGIVPGIKTLDFLCEMLEMPIGEIIEYVVGSESDNEKIIKIRTKQKEKQGAILAKPENSQANNQ